MCDVQHGDALSSNNSQHQTNALPNKTKTTVQVAKAYQQEAATKCTHSLLAD